MSDCVSCKSLKMRIVLLQRKNVAYRYFIEKIHEFVEYRCKHKPTKNYLNKCFDDLTERVNTPGVWEPKNDDES